MADQNKAPAPNMEWLGTSGVAAIDGAKAFLIHFMRENFRDRTFTRYIETRLAGDFAYEMARAIADPARSAAPAVPAVDALTRYDNVVDGPDLLSMRPVPDGQWFKRADVLALLATPSTAPDEQKQQRPTDDELWDQTIRDRDTYHEWADKLAEAISKHVGAYIGEHSNTNCPWAEALEAIEAAAHPADAGTVAVERAKPDLATHEGRLNYIRDFGDERLINAVRTGQTTIHAAIAQIHPLEATSDEPTAREQLIACLGDDAAKLEAENPGDEMAQTMREAAAMLGSGEQAESIDTSEFHALADAYHCANQAGLDVAYDALVRHVDDYISTIAKVKPLEAGEQMGGAQVAKAEPIYQVQFIGQGSAWNDASEAAYHTFTEKRRRIVYAAPSERAAEGKATSERKPLTDEEIGKLITNHGTGGWQTVYDMRRFGRAIEQHHGIGGGK